MLYHSIAKVLYIANTSRPFKRKSAFFTVGKRSRNALLPRQNNFFQNTKRNIKYPLSVLVLSITFSPAFITEKCRVCAASSIYAIARVPDTTKLAFCRWTILAVTRFLSTYIWLSINSQFFLHGTVSLHYYRLRWHAQGWTAYGLETNCCFCNLLFIKSITGTN